MITATDTADLQVTYDICIIGAGAMGLSLLEEFAKSRLRVACLIGGEEIRDPSWDKFNDCRISAHHHKGISQARPRVAGGATTLWGGQGLPFHDIDFENRSWVGLPGWPIKHGELKPYYQRARVYMGLPYAYPHQALASIRKNVADFLSPKLESIASEWTPQPNLFRVKRSKLAEASNLTLITGGQASHLLIGEGNVPNGVSFFGKDLTPRKLFAKKIILAAGAIENSRLLLQTEQSSGRKLFTSPFVGKCFQDHPICHYAMLFPKSPERISRCMGKRYLKNDKLMPKLHFPDEIQRNKGLLNAACHLIPEKSNFKCRGGSNKWMSLLLSLPQVARYILTRIFLRREYWGSKAYIIELHVEQEPTMDSSVSLSDHLLTANFYEPVLHWKLSDLTLLTIRKAGDYFVELFQTNGIGTCKSLLRNESSEALEESIHDVYHMIGTTRIGRTTAEGVVDLNCEVFDLPGVYVAGASVFPTGSFSNPTLTGIALSIRLADHIKKLMA